MIVLVHDALKEETMDRLVQFLQEKNALQEGAVPPELLAEFNRIEIARRNDPDRMTAADYLSRAQEERTPIKRYEYVKKALELEPGNCDAINMQLSMSEGRPDEIIQKYAQAVRAATAQMERDGRIREFAGQFWSETSLRPYMRLRASYGRRLKECGMYGLAEAEFEELFRLNPTDNQGNRYDLMQCYCALEKADKAMILYDISRAWLMHTRKEGQSLTSYTQIPTFQTDVKNELPDSALVFPMALLFYRIQDLERARHCIKIMESKNKSTLKFFRMIRKLPERLPEKADISVGYQPFTYSEYYAYYGQFRPLMLPVPSFPGWALTQLDRKKKG